MNFSTQLEQLKSTDIITGKVVNTYDASVTKWSTDHTYYNQGSQNQSIKYINGIELLGNGQFVLHHEEGRYVSNSDESNYEYVISDHLGNGRVWFQDLDDDGDLSLDPANLEVKQVKHYYPFGMTMGIQSLQSYSPPRDRNQYNGIEFFEGLDYNMAFYRTLDPGIGRWLQVDPKAEEAYGHTPYNSMFNNPISNLDPEGDFALSAVLIGAAIGAAVHTGVHLATNDFTFNNWNWGAFAGSVLAGGVGGGISSALTSAGIGGFSAGAITGGASGFTQNLTSGLINGNLTGKGLLNSTLLGAGIGGLAQGIGASIDGRRFWDGAKVRYELLIEDAGLRITYQDGKMNCMAACGEMVMKSQGYDFDQYDVRNWVGGDPTMDPIITNDALDKIYSKTSLNMRSLNTGIENMKLSSYQTHFVNKSLQEGKSVISFMPGTSRVSHTVTVKGLFIKHVTKVNGSYSNSLVYRLFDPAIGVRHMSYFQFSNTSLNVLSIWK